ncbi:MAG: HEPN domain-containing protein [Candidatus Jacksonbacteria bacterium]|nr:HEPN domain-containing protein [Candidatus Jacksonbacteria bacterium]
MNADKIRLVQLWITHAEDDLAFARAGLKDGFYNQVCMLCQQAVEKYLKACLVQAKGSIEVKEKIHDLAKLADFCKSHGFDFREHHVALRTLSEFYIPTRYPDASFDTFNKEDAEGALSMAEEIIADVKKSIVSG